MPPSLTPRRLPVFICYAHQDNESPDPSKRWLDRLRKHLAPLKDQLGAWSDREIEAGADWHEAIRQSLHAARAAVLLVSPDFLASSYIRNSELPALIRRARDEGLVVLPLILRPCLFEESLFRYPDPEHGPEEFSLASFQAVNPPDKPLSMLKEHAQDVVLVRLARRLLDEVRRPAQPPAPPIETPDLAAKQSPGLVETKLRPRLVRIEPGTFMMGSKSEVQISRPFLMSTTEVTQGQYHAVMNQNPSHFTGSPDLPVEKVSWFDAVRYCNALSDKEKLSRCYIIDGEKVTWPDGLTCSGYRLPTEAEWEYAARAGQDTIYAGSSEPDKVAWYDKNAGGKTHPVGQKEANAWGLHDMSGNVWEWVWDWYGDDSIKKSVDPMGPNSGSHRVVRGGSWSNDDPQDLRVANRGRDTPGNRSGIIGFRLSRSLP